MSENNKEKRVIYPLRLSPSERAELEELAAKVGLKLSSYLRQAGLNGDGQHQKSFDALVPEVNRRAYLDLAETNYQLRRIGININQIAKANNTALRLGHKLEVEWDLLSQLSQQLEELESWIEELRVELIGLDRSKRELDDR